MNLLKKKNLISYELSVRLETTYLVETENFLLKVKVKVKIS